MNPVLKAPDILHVVPYKGEEEIQPGDVIVFPHPEGSQMVVHRVSSVNAQSIRTRGDRNSKIDPWVLNPDGIVGRVVWAQRGASRLSIWYGLKGRLYSCGMRVIRMIDVKTASLLHPAYHMLANAGVFRRLLPARMQTRVLSFDRSTGREFQLLMGRRVIGRLLPFKDTWDIRRPYRLFVIEASLPQGGHDRSTYPP
jgi:hypothetical protein